MIDPNIPKILFGGIVWTVILWQITKIYKISTATLGRATIIGLLSVIINYVTVTFGPADKFMIIFLINLVIFTAVIMEIYKLTVKYAVAVTLTHLVVSYVVLIILGVLIGMTLGVDISLKPKYGS
jgi:hypothetical protein